MFQMLNSIRDAGLSEICQVLHKGAMNQINPRNKKSTVYAMEEVGVELMMEALMQLIWDSIVTSPELGMTEEEFTSWMVAADSR